MNTTHSTTLEQMDETIRPLEYSAHIVWAEAKGLKQLLRNSAPEEIEANKGELIEAANMILAALETEQ
jgi:hypothetical protein